MLKEAGLIDGVENQFDVLNDDKSPHEQKVSLLNRPLFEVRLFKRVQIGPGQLWIFYAFAVAMLAMLAFNHETFLGLDLANFLKSPTGYELALVKLVTLS